MVFTKQNCLQNVWQNTAKQKCFDNMEILADGLTHDQARSIEGALIKTTFEGKS